MLTFECGLTDARFSVGGDIVGGYVEVASAVVVDGVFERAWLRVRGGEATSYLAPVTLFAALFGRLGLEIIDGGPEAGVLLVHIWRWTGHSRGDAQAREAPISVPETSAGRAPWRHRYAFCLMIGDATGKHGGRLCMRCKRAYASEIK